MLYANNNLLSDFDYDQLNPETLGTLVLNNNNLRRNELSVFRHLINLQELVISNRDRQADWGICNRFSGCL